MESPSQPSVPPPRLRVIKDVLILFGVQITGYLVPLLALPYLTRTLGPSQFGLLALGSAFALYFSIVVDYGFAVTGARRTATARDAATIGEIYYTINAAKLLLAAGCLIIFLAAVLFLPQFSQYRALYLLSFLHVIGFGFSPNWFFQGIGQMRWVAICDYAAKILSVGAIFFTVHRPEDYLRAAALQSGGFLAASLIGHTVILTRFRPVWTPPTMSGVRNVLAEAWPVFLSFASLIAMTSTNTLILGFIASPADTGYLNAAQRIIIATRALTNPITNAVYPRMSRLVAEDPQAALRFLRRQVLFTCLPFAAISIGLLILGPWTAQLLYGPEFADTGTLLRILSPVPLAHAASMCFSTYFMLAFGHERAWNRLILASVALNFLLIPLFLLVLRPSYAIALTGTIVDIFSASASFLFYRRSVQQLNNSDNRATFT